MKTVLIIGRKNGAGLDQDAALVGAALGRAGWTVRHYAPLEWRAFFRREKADAVVHLERFFPWWRIKARRQVLIPNQERFPARHLGRLKQVGSIWCKSRHAEAIFGKLHAATRFIGFTSPDRRLEAVAPDYGRFFHLAGRSTVKGTDVLLALWAKHPEWPRLTLVQHPDNAPKAVPPNVELVARRVSDEELRAMQNACGVHLCPSLSEGWGHYIVEAMSCAAVVVTTDGPPMNELVTPERGVVVPFARSEPRHLGTNFYVDPAALEQAIASLATRGEPEKRALGNAARRWFEENDRGFAERLRAAFAQ